MLRPQADVTTPGFPTLYGAALAASLQACCSLATWDEAQYMLAREWTVSELIFEMGQAGTAENKDSESKGKQAGDPEDPFQGLRKGWRLRNK